MKCAEAWRALPNPKTVSATTHVGWRPDLSLPADYGASSGPMAKEWKPTGTDAAELECTRQTPRRVVGLACSGRALFRGNGSTQLFSQGSLRR